MILDSEEEPLYIYVVIQKDTLVSLGYYRTLEKAEREAQAMNQASSGDENFELYIVRREQVY